MHRSHKPNTSSFNKFVARIQHSFSSKTTKTSTMIQPSSSSSSECRISTRFQLSEILYDPTRSIEYISEIKNISTSSTSSSIDSTVFEQDDQLNLSQMNISYTYQQSPRKRVQLPNRNQLHSTAIHDITRF